MTTRTVRPDTLRPIALSLLLGALLACQPSSTSDPSAGATTAAATTGAGAPATTPTTPATPKTTGASANAGTPGALPGKQETERLGYPADDELQSQARYESMGRMFRKQGRCASVAGQEEILCWVCPTSGEGHPALLIGSAEELFIMDVKGTCGESMALSFPDKRFPKPEERQVTREHLRCGDQLLKLTPLEEGAAAKVRAEARLRSLGAPRKLQKLYTRPNGEIIMVQTATLGKTEHAVEVAMGTPPRLTFKTPVGGGLDKTRNLEVKLKDGGRLFFPFNTFTINPVAGEGPEDMPIDMDNTTVTNTVDGKPIIHPANTTVDFAAGGWRFSTYQTSADAAPENLRFISDDDYEAVVTWPRLPRTHRSACHWFGIEPTPPQ